MTPITFTLSEIDKNTGLWLSLKGHMERQLAAARVRNDWSLPEHETATIRGEIACLKRLISLGDDRPKMTGNDE